jgi:hypothetical protein
MVCPYYVGILCFLCSGTLWLVPWGPKHVVATEINQLLRVALVYLIKYLCRQPNLLTFRSCTLFQDVDPLHFQRNEETCVEGETSSLKDRKIWVFPNFASGKNSSCYPVSGVVHATEKLPATWIIWFLFVYFQWWVTLLIWHSGSFLWLLLPPFLAYNSQNISGEYCDLLNRHNIM